VSYFYEQAAGYPGGKPEKKIDLPRFAADLAKELGGEVSHEKLDYPGERQKIRLGADELWLGANNWKKRVSASLHAPDVPWNDRNMYDRTHRTEDASVNPDGRSIAAIARDIKKRVIDASQSALAAQRAHATQQNQNRAAIVRHAAALKAARPELNVRVDEDSQKAVIYTGSGEHYVSATMHSDGSVGIDRLGSVSAEVFGQIMALVNGSK
jgi:hypothetical protein